ncbi:MAG: PQQ-binding-like beta-propeller repeat protein [Planctomycetota bacterium]
MIRIFIAVGVLIGFQVAGTQARDSDWLRFRGPNGTGVAAGESSTPVTWSETENLKWKLALPGPGSSCPIVVGDRVFVTSWSGYAENLDDPGDQQQLKRHLTCVDRNSGAVVWTRDVAPYLPEDEYRGMFAENGYASHTPVSDGEAVYVFFGKTGAVAFDMDGNQLWLTAVGTESGAKGWGSASSPILYDDLLIVTASAESESMVALNKKTGEEVWRAEASGFNSVWGTPVLVRVDDTRTDIVIGVPGEIWGFNPANGKLRWLCEGLGSNSFCSSVVAADGVIYALESGPSGGGGIAIRAGGKGDITDTHVVWSGRQSGRIGSPLVVDGKIYTFSRGVANCFSVADGEQLAKERMQASTAAEDPQRGGGRRRGRGGGQDYGSPIMADGKIYYTTRAGDTHVFGTGEKLQTLAVNRVTSEREDFSATPAISDGEIYLRSSKHLYCVAE